MTESSAKAAKPSSSSAQIKCCVRTTVAWRSPAGQSGRLNRLLSVRYCGASDCRARPSDRGQQPHRTAEARRVQRLARCPGSRDRVAGERLHVISEYRGDLHFQALRSEEHTSELQSPMYLV